MRRILFYLGLVLTSVISAQDFRYTEVITPTSQVTSGVVYGQAPFLNFPYSNENNTTLSDLVMDVYQPTGDLHNQRAAIVFAHSGGFIVGNRNHDDMVAICDSFARKGYVTATIDYRQGFYLLNNVPLHGIRAVYRGIQDGRAAVRFLRANAAAYGIDPDQVYLAGSSAGAFISLQSIYLSAQDEIPAEVGVNTYTDLFFPQTSPDLGPPDVGANLSESGTPNGVIGLWGAVADPSWVDPEDNQPVFLAHGSADETVPFTIGPPFGAGTFPDVYGSAVIADELAVNGTSNVGTYFVPEGEHEFHGTDNGSWENGQGGNARWDTLIGSITNFLWEQHRPMADFTVTTQGLAADFTEATTDGVSWLWTFGDGNTATGPNPTHVYASGGTYTVRLYVENELLSWDTLSQTVTVDASLPLSWTGAPTAQWLGKDAELSWSASNVTDLSRFAIEHAREGQAFSVIGTTAAENSADLTHYNFYHPSPGVGRHLYRLRAHDLDGTEHLSEIAVLEASDQVTVWPNPTSGWVTLAGLPEGTWKVQVVDVIGRIRTIDCNDGRLDLSLLPAGMYTLSIDELSTSIRVMRALD